MIERTKAPHAQPLGLDESISALMDNQASELELRRLLNVLVSDANEKSDEEKVNVLSTWSRYQIASASLRGELPLLASSNFAARVNAVIAEEDAHTVAHTVLAHSKRSDNAKWWQQAGRVAVAASVAGVLIVGVQQYQTLDPNTTDLIAAESNASPNTIVAANIENKAANLPSGINAPALSARTVAVQSGYESRPQENRRVMFMPGQDVAPVYNEDISRYVNQLIQEHTNNASQNSGQGMLPYTRVILIDED